MYQPTHCDWRRWEGRHMFSLGVWAASLEGMAAERRRFDITCITLPIATPMRALTSLSLDSHANLHHNTVVERQRFDTTCITPPNVA